MKISGERVLGRLFWPVVIVFAFFAVTPLYLLFKVTVSSPTEVLTQHPSFIVEQFTSAHWQRVIDTGVLWPPFQKSLIVATLTAGLAIVIATPGAYAIAQLPSRLKYSIILTMFVTRMLPEVAIALPIAVTFIRLNLIETELGLALAHLILALPLVTWILVGTFETVPKDLEEAAMTDGCSRLRALWHVSIPLALPGISVAVIYTWLLSWEEFTYAVYLSILDKTLPLKIFQFVAGGELFFSSTFAVIVTIPVLIITYSLQKYLRAGYLAGGVKG